MPLKSTSKCMIESKRLFGQNPANTYAKSVLFPGGIKSTSMIRKHQKRAGRPLADAIPDRPYQCLSSCFSDGSISHLYQMKHGDHDFQRAGPVLNGKMILCKKYELKKLP